MEFVIGLLAIVGAAGIVTAIGYGAFSLVAGNTNRDTQIQDLYALHKSLSSKVEAQRSEFDELRTTVMRRERGFTQADLKDGRDPHRNVDGDPYRG